MKENFIKRSITGYFLAIAAAAWMFVGTIYLTTIFGEKPQWSAYSFMTINTLLFIVAMYEIVKLRKPLKWNIWIKGLIFIMAVVFLWMPLGDEKFGPYIYNSQWFHFWITLLVYFSFVAMFLVIRLTVKNFTNNDLVFIFFWTFYLVFVFKGINFLMLQSQDIRKLGWPTMTYIWVIVLSNDIGAYFGGLLWGKKLLAPKISPKKTWEGAITGFVFSVVFSTILVTLLLELGNYNPLPIYQGSHGKAPVYIAYIGISCILSILSQSGDFLFSYLKRNHNVKDFSNIFPGHGGLLDRLDGFSLVVLVTYFFTFLLLGVY
ncbi:MAG: phosphatidate cytidylyltransferase [Spiroplasma sp.]